MNIKITQKEVIPMFLGVVLLFVLIQLLFSVFDLSCCTYNNFTCENRTKERAWDGKCTDRIIDECCIDVRMCGGQIVDHAWDCPTRYCVENGEVCMPVPLVQGDKYQCTCMTKDEAEEYFDFL